MSSRDLGARTGNGAPARRGETRLTLGLFIGLLASLAPLPRVIAVGPWVLGAVALAALLLAVGYTARRLRLPGMAVTLIELTLWLLIMTVIYARDTALLGLIPTPEAFAVAPELVQVAANEILLGVAPLEPTVAMTFIVVAAMGLLTIALDHVVLTARMPLLAAVALIAIWLIPSIAVPAGENVISFVLLAAAMLYLIRAETRTREAPERAGVRAGAGVTAMAAGIGVTAIALTVITAQPLPPAGSGSGGLANVASIDATLELGEDLRRPSDMEVLRVRSNAPAVPYLRVATLSQFDGEVWTPDRYRSVDLGEAEAFGLLGVDEDVRITQYRTTIEVGALASARLPVPFPAVTVEGLNGAWRAVAANRTVVTAESSTQGQTYEVVTHVPRPTREKIRDADATMPGVSTVPMRLPERLPPIIAETAREITAGATNDYDRLVALQAWFRGSQFSYSLRAPVEEGFDGTGADAVAEFLDVREGYCVHFASAFAVMARTLDMPSRIVVGFLPGEATNETVDGERIAAVTTSMVHAWPEVYFDGIGWVPFEPTKSLGTPTSFLPEASGILDDDGEDIAGPTPTASPTPSGSAAPRADEDDPTAGGAGPGAAPIDFRPLLWTLGVMLILAAVPGLAARIRLDALLRRARNGDVGAARRIVQQIAIDLGIPVVGAESPRAFGTRLTTAHGAPVDAMDRLVAAVEHASYARRSPGAADLATDAAAVRRGLLSAAPPRARALALLVPRSLVIRPGSGVAERRGLPSVVPASTR